MRARHWLVATGAVAAIAGMALAAAACGDDDDTKSSGSDLVSANVDCKDLGVTAPKRIKDAGKVVIGSDLSYAPIDFTKEGTNTLILANANTYGGDTRVTATFRHVDGAWRFIHYVEAPLAPIAYFKRFYERFAEAPPPRGAG